MTPHGHCQSPSLFSKAAAILTLAAFLQPVGAQNAQLAQRVQEIKQSQAANKKLLARYTWEEQQTISIRGQVRKASTYLVRIGPGGQKQKTEINAQPAAQPSGGRLKQRIIAKKKEEFEEYAEQIAALAKQYTQFDPDTFQDAFQKGNVSLQLGPDQSALTLVIKSFLKTGDQVTLTFGRQQKALHSFNVSSYLSDPSDAVKINVQFAKVPNGPNHPSSILVNGVSKQLTVAIQNSNYQLTS